MLLCFAYMHRRNTRASNVPKDSQPSESPSHVGEPLYAANQANGHDLKASRIDSTGAPNINPHSTSTTNQSSSTASRNSITAQSSSSHNPFPAAPPHNIARDKLDISLGNKNTRQDLLREALFSEWKDDATNADLGDPAELQKKDPLATQLWRLYSKTKTQLPNQERMENLTWRLMAMNMKRQEREHARWVVRRSPCIHSQVLD